MKHAYVVIAYLIAALVLLQTALITAAVFGLADALASEADPVLAIDAGYADAGLVVVHRAVGGYAIPVLTLVLLLISFKTLVIGTTRWALIVVVTSGLQILFANLGKEFGSGLGAAHGLTAIALFAVAAYAGFRVRRAPVTEDWNLDDWR